jgi:hypothetical protein
VWKKIVRYAGGVLNWVVASVSPLNGSDMAQKVAATVRVCPPARDLGQMKITETN